MNDGLQNPRVGIVVVSHSDLIARGVVELVGEMGPDVRVIPAGGTADGRLGTDVERVMAGIQQADGGAGVVVLSDLGSAVLSAETAVELLGAAWSGKAIVAQGPLVEGAVAAAVLAQTGAGLRDVARAATGTTPATGAFPAVRGYARTATLTNPDGLHARPAAEFVKLAVSLGHKVTVNGKDARSLLSILSLGLAQGATVEIAAEDPMGKDAVDRLVELVESGFSSGGSGSGGAG
ncbi:dihydroxyacetone kinase phosphoryl donor subunit DhaM [Rathayibacter sp. KR2-224]|uniref:dihydroxyacetone kinase phosphoryl donor subunit DhaM n=1 Tax=Rathayibacter sp. KR2-224 TaxID=3400913 RepID=UPI003C0DEF6F